MKIKSKDAKEGDFVILPFIGREDGFPDQEIACFVCHIDPDKGPVFRVMEAPYGYPISAADHECFISLPGQEEHEIEKITKQEALEHRSRFLKGQFKNITHEIEAAFEVQR